MRLFVAKTSHPTVPTTLLRRQS